MSKTQDQYIPPPTKGLSYAAVQLDGDPAYARQLDNFFCRSGGLEFFQDQEMHADALNNYMCLGYRPPNNFGGAGTVFVVNQTTQFVGTLDSAGVFTPQFNLGVVPGVRYQYLNVQTAAGTFTILRCGDTYFTYNGAWAAAGIVGPAAGRCGPLISYRQRIYFLELTTLGFWYLPVGAVAGAATFFNAGTVFTKGGQAVALQVITGDDGLGTNDTLVIWSSEGEVAVFRGNDPAAATWEVLGCFFIGKPFYGLINDPQRQIVQFGGDVCCLTERGLLSITAILRGSADQATVSLTYQIDPVLRFLAKQYLALPRATVFVLPSLNVLCVHFYVAFGFLAGGPFLHTFYMDLTTRAWSRGTGLGSSSPSLWGSSAVMIEVDYPANMSVILGMEWGGTDIRRSVPSRVFQGPGVVASAYSRLKVINPQQTLQLKPWLYSTATFNYSVCIGSDLKDNYQPETRGANTWEPAGRFFGTFNTGSAAAFMTSKWGTVAGSPATCQSLYLSFTVANTAITDISFLGWDIRSAPLGLGGP